MGSKNIVIRGMTPDEQQLLEFLRKNGYITDIIVANQDVSVGVPAKQIDFSKAFRVNPLEPVAEIFLDNLNEVSTDDMDKAIKRTNAYIELSRKMVIPAAEIKNNFEAYYYEEQQPVDISTLEGEFLIINYQLTTNMALIQQTLPPSAAGKVILVETYLGSNTVGSLEIFPRTDEHINGGFKTITTFESGVLGVFIPTQGGYEFINVKQMHDFHFTFKDDTGTYRTAKSIESENGLELKYRQSDNTMIISPKSIYDGFVKIKSSAYQIENNGFLQFDTNYYGEEKDTSSAVVSVEFESDTIFNTTSNLTLTFNGVAKSFSVNQGAAIGKKVFVFPFNGGSLNVNNSIKLSGLPSAVNVQFSAVAVQFTSSAKTVGETQLIFNQLINERVVYYNEVLGRFADVEHLFSLPATVYNKLTKLQPGVYINPMTKTRITGGGALISLEPGDQLPFKFMLNLFMENVNISKFKGGAIPSVVLDVGAVQGSYRVMTFGHPDDKNTDFRIATDIVNDNPVLNAGWVKTGDHEILQRDNFNTKIDLPIAGYKRVAVSFLPATVRNPSKGVVREMYITGNDFPSLTIIGER